MTTAASMTTLAAMALELPRFMLHSLSVDEACEALRRRMASREERFLEVARLLIFSNPRSPHARLLAWAGIQEGDLASLVRSVGLDQALRGLRDAGVRVSMEQLKGMKPIERNGLYIEVSERDFDAPARGGLLGSSSGTRSSGTRVSWDWALIEEHASNELMLHSMHGLIDRPLALWLPVPPGLAGMHFALLCCRSRRSISRWYSPVAPGQTGSQILGRRALALGTAYIRACSVLSGVPIPRPRVVLADEAEVIASWMSGRCAVGAPPILRSYASSAIRVVRAAIERGLNLKGSVALTGGEPLTEAARQFLADAGVSAVPRYSASEAGLIGAACPEATTADDMHIYMDRLAVIGASEAGTTPTDLLFTSLSPHTGKVLLNTDIGDEAILEPRNCSCELGSLGMNLRVREVRSNQKLTTGGMAIPRTTLESIAAAEVVRNGGAPTDLQICEVADAGVATRIEILISPRVILDEQEFLEVVNRKLSSGPNGGELAARIWTEGRLLRIVRAEPEISRGHKQPLTVRRESPSPH